VVTVSLDEDQAALTGDVALIMSSLLRNLADTLTPPVPVVEATDGDWIAVREALDEGPKLKLPVEFNWDQLRLVVQGAVHKEDRPVEVIGRRIGVPTLGAFLRGNRATFAVENLIRVMWWLGYYDIREFCKEI
jgi:hypothetical protein